MFDYSYLRGRMAEKRRTQYDLAKRIGVSDNTLSRTLTQGRGFRAEQIWAICDDLGIKSSEIGRFFFTRQFDQIEH